MLSSRLCDLARAHWQAARSDLGALAPALAEQIQAVPGDEGVLLALAYGTLPISDTAGVPLPVINSYGKHALFLRRESPFCRDLPEDMFLHFVWYPRVNSEDLTDCRAFFYRQLAPLVEGLGDEQAVLAVNRWCAGHMTYQLSDERTESPMTAFMSGTGRCGEESVFLVTALRSVGIPARQVYAPLWAHCDDNHAWVEAWAGGRWHFLGACEPEPILDRGWFTGAAARAPLVHYRTWFDCAMGDEQVERMGSVGLYGVTGRYAETCSLTVRVTCPDGTPAAGAAVELDVVNMAAFRPIIRNRTDENGCFRAELGRSGLHVEASLNGLTGAADVRPEGGELEVCLTLAPPMERTWECELTPPAPSARNRTVLTPAQREENAAVLAACARARAQRVGDRQRPEHTAAEEPWPRLFALAAGNAPELYRFYRAHQGAERAMAGQMLRSMAEKDCRDVTFETLQSHFQAALPYAGAEHFVEEILDPRIGFEVLTNWRPAVLAAFDEPQRRAFAARPEELMAYIRGAFPDPTGSWYPTLTMTPAAVLACGRADEKARRILFAAVLRTLGVPARLDPADGGAEYWRDGQYHPASPEEDEPAELCFVHGEGERFVYGADWTLARREDDSWRVLDLSGAEDPVRVKVRPGLYRLVTARRLPNGRQLCRVTDTLVQPGSFEIHRLIMRTAKPEEMLSRIPLDPVELRDEAGERLTTDKLFSGAGILAWLSPGEEPTEHILNELLAAAPDMGARMEAGTGLALVFPDAAAAENGAVRRVLSALPGVRVLYDPGRGAEVLARKLFLEPGVLPLVALLDEHCVGRFGSAGYQVGVVELVMKLADCLEM